MCKDAPPDDLRCRLDSADSCTESSPRVRGLPPSTFPLIPCFARVAAPCKLIPPCWCIDNRARARGVSPSVFCTSQFAGRLRWPGIVKFAFQCRSWFTTRCKKPQQTRIALLPRMQCRPHHDCSVKIGVIDGVLAEVAVKAQAAEIESCAVACPIH